MQDSESYTSEGESISSNNHYQFSDADMQKEQMFGGDSQIDFAKKFITPSLNIPNNLNPDCQSAIKKILEDYQNNSMTVYKKLSIQLAVVAMYGI